MQPRACPGSSTDCNLTARGPSDYRPATTPDESATSLHSASRAGGISRRALLAGAGALGLGLAVGGGIDVHAAVHRRRKPGSLPRPHLPEGTDTLPQIEHIIALMNRPSGCIPGSPGPIPSARGVMRPENRGFGSVPLARYLWPARR